MNLPTYALADSPSSNIINLYLGLPPPTKPVTASINQKPHQTQSPAIIKGKARETDLSQDHHYFSTHQTDKHSQHVQFRATKDIASNLASSSLSSISSSSSSSSLSSSSSSSSNIKISPCPNSDDHLQLLNRTGWDEIFATANSDGWVIYRTYPLQVIHKHVVPNGSLRIVIPLHRTNILYLVGGPPSPLYSPNKVVLYDSSKSQAIFSIELTQPVVGLTARRDMLVVVLRNRVHLFRITNRLISEEGHWETSDNPKGLACLGSDFGSSLLVFLGRQSGKVQLVTLPPFQPEKQSDPSTEPFRPIRIEKSNQAKYPSTSILVAHTTSLASLAITPDGKLIATASVTGTLIRIWDSKTSALLRELRRGTDGAAMWGLRFRPDGLAICASSDKGTIHVWSLKDKAKSRNLQTEGKQGRPLALLKPYLPKYFHSTWSDAFFRLPPPGPTAIKSLPLSLFSSLPNTSLLSSSKPGDMPTGMMKHSSEQTQTVVNKPPTIEDDVSSVGWVLAPTGGFEAKTNQSVIEPQIIAITRSGGWFRLRIPDHASIQNPNTQSHQSNRGGQHQHFSSMSGTSNHGTTNRLGISNDPSVQLECVEYRRFGQVEDWSDSDDSN